MKNLVINSIKNINLSNVKATPNQLILVRETVRVNEITADVSNTIKYIEVCEIKDTKPYTLVNSLLRFALAEAFVSKKFNENFGDTGIQNKKIFNQFLGTCKIYRSNSEGRIIPVLTSERPLKETALSLKDRHTLTSCKPENRKAALHRHTNAVLAQLTYLTNIASEAEKLNSELDKKEPKKETAKGELVKETAQ